MKILKLTIIFFFSIILLSSCNEEPGEIQVQNNISNAVLKNIEWGDVAISEQLLPGETSEKIFIYDYNYYYELKLPDKKPVKFYLELNGDKIYLETRMEYLLNYDEYILITIDDTTKVFNPMIDN